MVRRPFAPLAILLGSTLAAAAAPPANDDFSKALTIPAEVGVVGTLTEATSDPAECKPTVDMPTPVAVWYRVKAIADGTLVFDTSGSNRNTLHLCIVKTPVGGTPTFLTLAGPRSIGAALDGDAIAVASVAVLTGDVVAVGVTDDEARIGDDQPQPFQLNTHALPDPAGGTANQLVLSPNSSYVVGLRQFDDPKTFTIPMPNVINVAPVAVDEPKVQSGYPAGTIAATLARPGALASGAGVGLKLTSVGNGPAFGQVGTYVRDAIVSLFSGGVRVGRGVQRIFLLSAAADSTESGLRFTLSRRSDAGRVGDIRRFQMTVTNAMSATARGCFVFGYPFAYAVGTTVDTPPGWNFRFRAMNPTSGKPLAGWNTPVSIGKGRSVRFDIEQRVAALGFHAQPVLPLCTDPFSSGFGLDGVFGKTSLAGFGYPTAVADALVEPVNLPTDAIAPEPGKSVDVVYTVRNYGTKRKLSVFPSDRFPGIPTTGFEPVPVSRKICQANTAGACLGAMRSSLTLDFASGQTRTFRVRWTRNGDIPHGKAGIYVNVLQGGNPVGVAGIAITQP